MTNKTNTFEGQTSGTAWTSAGSGGGSWDALDTLITAGSGATGVYDSSQFMHGSQSLAISGPSTSQWIPAWTLSGSVWSVRMYIRISSFTSAQDIAQIRNSGGQASTIGLNSSRALQLKNASGTSIETLATLSLDTWYRLEWWGSKGTTTSNGTTLISIYAGDSTTAISSSSTGNANQNTGTTDYTQLRIGKLTSASAINFYIDSVSVRDDASGALGTFLRSGAGDSSLTLSNTGIGKKSGSGSGASSLSLNNTGIGAKNSAGSGASLLTVTGTGQGQKKGLGSGSSTLIIGGNGAGSKQTAGSGSSALTVTGAGGGWKAASGSGISTLTITGSGSGVADIPPDVRYGSGSSSLTLSSSGSGFKTSTAAGASDLSLDSDGAGFKTTFGSGICEITISATGAGTRQAVTVDPIDFSADGPFPLPFVTEGPYGLPFRATLEA